MWLALLTVGILDTHYGLRGGAEFLCPALSASMHILHLGRFLRYSAAGRRWRATFKLSLDSLIAVLVHGVVDLTA